MTSPTDHDASRYDRAFRLGIGMNVVYVIIEASAGLAFGSVALISDAGHNLSDVLALTLAWGGVVLARAQPTERRTYGLKRATILASLGSALLLCVALGAVGWEAIARLNTPAPTNSVVIMVVAGAGVVINGLTAALFLFGRRTDLNIRGAFLHMVADASVSFGVVLAGLVIYFTDWWWVDPVAALVVALVILASGVALLRESLDLTMDAVPRHIDPAAVREYLEELPGVVQAHHLHIWGMSTTETALTVHLVVSDLSKGDELLRTVSQDLSERFSIQHPTIQIELGSDAACYAASPGA